MLSVVATETPRIIQMPDVVREPLPAHAHFGKIISVVNLLHFCDRLLDFRLSGNSKIRMGRPVELLDGQPDAVESALSRGVGNLQRLHRQALYPGEGRIDPP